MQQRPEHRHRDALAPSVATPGEQAGQRRLAGEDAGVEPGHVGTEPYRRVADTAERRGVFGHRLYRQLGGGLIREGALLAPAGDGHVHQVRVVRSERRRIEAEPIRLARPEGLDDDVGPIDEAPNQRPTVGILEVHREAALVAVQGGEGGTEQPVGAEVVAVAPCRVAAEALDLDHLGPEVAEP